MISSEFITEFWYLGGVSGAKTNTNQDPHHRYKREGVLRELDRGIIKSVGVC
jgi:hypothetical protein